jgi:hypothetical protein
MDGAPRNAQSEAAVISNLVALLVSSICKSEDEWQDWGEPFLETTFVAQFGDVQGPIMLAELKEKFHPILSEHISLWIENNNEEEDYSHISFAEQRITSELQNMTIDPNSDLDSSLQQYLDRFFHYTTTCKTYDARARVVARKVCLMLNKAAQDFASLEQEHLSHTSTGSHDYLESLKASVDSIPRSSLLTPHRVLKVALVAAAGGALVGMASLAAAPAMVSTVVPLLSATSEMMQVSIVMETFLSYAGVLACPVIPSVFGSYGGSVASQQMLKRTAPIDHFELLPLQNSSCSERVEKKSGAVAILVSGHVRRGHDEREIWGADGPSCLVDEDGDSKETGKSESTQSVVDHIASVIVEKAALLGHPFYAFTQANQKYHSHKPTAEQNKDFHITSTVANMATVPSIASVSHRVEGEAEEGKSDGSCVVAEEVHVAEEMGEVVEGDWEHLAVRCRLGWWRQTLPQCSEAFLLSWERNVLGKLQDSFLDIVTDKLYSKLYSKVMGQLWSLTPWPVIQSSMGLPLSVIKKIETLNDPWAVVMDRARQAGCLLARALVAEKKKCQESDLGQCFRPVNLIGYGMGARVIFHALQDLYDAGSEGLGIVENAVLIGAPIAINIPQWKSARQVVAHRLVNCYSSNDWILALLYRSKSLELSVAGLYPVHLTDHSANIVHTPALTIAAEHCSKTTMDKVETVVAMETVPTQKVYSDIFQSHSDEVENFDVTDLARNHCDYPLVLREILTLVHL